ncbi:MAG: adenine deaminase C-terminal domain-containing protein [Thermodesulfobacteriota bacterium]
MPLSLLNRMLAERDVPSLMDTALGKIPADLVVVNARLLNVYSGEILSDTAVAVKNGWIAATGTLAPGTIGSETRIIDAAGQTLIPGFIEGHTHLATLMTPDYFIPHAIRHGTTTIITETMETYPVAGLEGVMDFLSCIRHQPITMLATAPALASISPAGSRMSLEDLRTVLDHEAVIGLGESYWQAVMKEPSQYLDRFREALLRDQVLEGHSAGAGGAKLMAYAATGVSSCHEAISAQDALDRLRLGITVMIREGSIRRELAAISAIAKQSVSCRRLVLVTDGVNPLHLLQDGYLDAIVQRAIDLGFPPIDAVRMATLNVAEHFQIDAVVGGIAPGRQADLVLIPEPDCIRPRLVIARGTLLWEEGKDLPEVQRHAFSDSSRHTVRLGASPIDASRFRIDAPPTVSEVKVRVMNLITELVTKEAHESMPVVQGQVCSDPSRDIAKVAAIDRRYSPGKTAVGFIRGFGLRSGAFATSAAWDTTDIVVVGATDADMASAVRRIHELQGGFVVCDQGKVLAELALPVMGLMAQEPAQAIREKMDAVTAAVHALGSKLSDPMLTLTTLTTAAIPYLRICEEGLFDLKSGRFLDVCL